MRSQVRQGSTAAHQSNRVRSLKLFLPRSRVRSNQVRRPVMGLGVLGVGGGGAQRVEGKLQAHHIPETAPIWLAVSAACRVCCCCPPAAVCPLLLLLLPVGVPMLLLPQQGLPWALVVCSVTLLLA